MTRKTTKKITKILAEFLLSFLVIAIVFFIWVNFGALNSKIHYWIANTFGIGGSGYFLSSVDGLGLEEDLVPPDDRLVVPKIGINVPLAFTDSFDTEAMLAGLNRGVLAYPGMALPGRAGNTFLAGHSSQNPWEKGAYKNVFSLIDNLEQNDKLLIYFEGVKYVYVVDDKAVVASNDLSVLAPSQTPTITLMTCWPVGTTARRLIVKGHLSTGTAKDGHVDSGSGSGPGHADYKTGGRSIPPEGQVDNEPPTEILQELPTVR